MRTIQTRTRRAVLLLPAALLALGGCAQQVGGGAGSAGGTVSLVKAGELKTCTHLPYPPFQSSQGSSVVGFDVDLIDLVAKNLKVRQTFLDTPFEGIQSGEALNSAQCDVAAAGMTITPTREKVLDFSDPYFEATQALLVAKGSPVRGLGDLRGKTLAVQLGTTGEEYAKAHQQANGYTIRQFEDLALLQGAVKTGQVAAGINDNGVLYDYAKKNPDTTVASEFSTGEKYGFGVRTGNTALRTKINTVLAAAKRDGSYARIYRKWFGTDPKQG